MSGLDNYIYTYSNYLKKKFGCKCYKIGLSTNYSCPHKEESGGCFFCNTTTFTDIQQNGEHSIDEQVRLIKNKIEKKCGKVKYLAFFHDNTATYGNIDKLKQIFSYPLLHRDVLGLVVSTRPDSLDKRLLEWLDQMGKPVTIELGLQTVKEGSLLFLNRGHTLVDTEAAIDMIGNCKNIDIGLHIMLGIPGENCMDAIRTVKYAVAKHKAVYLKLHNLVIYKGTKLADYLRQGKIGAPFKNDFREYLKLLGQLLPHIPGNIAIGRLFTTNLHQSQIALNPFPGIKKTWLNDLFSYLKMNNIIQGSETAIKYNFHQKEI